MTDSLRAFISLPVAPKVVRAIVKFQEGIKGADVRWTPREQIHLTLKFLGNISSAEVERLKVALEGVMQPLRLRAEGVGGFPSRRQARVIWVGLTGDIDTLKALHAAVEEVVGQKENRPFRPHLTIGRARKPYRVGDWENLQFGEWEVRELQLMQSKLSPKGATHTVIARFEG